MTTTQIVIPLSVPQLTGSLRRYLDECIETNYVSSVGPFVTRFEKAFAKFVGSRYAVACVNGTAALHLAVRLLQVKPGDEVIVPSFTFVASVNAVLYEQGLPILVDSERHSWNLDAELVANEIKRRAKQGKRLPRAVEVVHILGHPAEVEPIMTVCQEYGIPVFEDAAESLGATYRVGRFAGKQVGTIGKIGCFSFNGNKIITAGGGGMLTTDDQELARRAKHLTTQAKLPGHEYWHDEIGYNYRLTNVSAAIGLSQLEQLPEFLCKKQAIAATYDNALGRIPGVTLPPRVEGVDPSMWLYSLLIDPVQFGCDRNGILRRFADNGIEARPLWSPLHKMPPYKNFPYVGSDVAEYLFVHGITLPCSVGLQPHQQEAVIECLLKCRGTSSAASNGRQYATS
jgi:aminotransferase in exopolysaccharide biosynthesis